MTLIITVVIIGIDEKTRFNVFTARCYASAEYARPSVRLLQVRSFTKRCRTVAQKLQFSDAKDLDGNRMALRLDWYADG